MVLRRLFCYYALITFIVVALTTTPGGAIEVAMVVAGDPFELGDLTNPGDVLIADFLVDRGYEINLIAANMRGFDKLDISDEADLTIVSESIGSNQVAVQLNETTTPLITTEGFLYDDMNFVLPGDEGQSPFAPEPAGVLDITIVDPDHPLAAGLPAGDVAIFDGPGYISWGQNLGGDFSIIATVAGDPSKATYFVYEAGAELLDGSTVPAMRIGLPQNGITLDPFPQWTTEGEALFAAAVDYALGIGPPALEGDFDGSGALDLLDVNMLNAEINVGTNGDAFDLNADTVVDAADLRVWVKDLKKTWFGDANLDGLFTTGDLVSVLGIGKFNTGEEAGWEEGDWTGDLRFNSADIVKALADGGFEAGPVAATAAVPEPSSFIILTILALGVMLRRRPC